MNTKLIYSSVIIFLEIVLFHGFTQAQQVLASSGAFGQSTVGSISYTLGEGAISTQTNGNTTLTQGFQQTQIVVTAVSEATVSGFSIALFPNPTHDFITLKIEKGETRDLEYILFDAQGKILLKQKLTGAEVQVPFTQFNPGSYAISIRRQGREMQIFKVIKTQH